ncbi:hypothetical protein [Bradyrhizobium sp. STM 3561]|uniref:hypothetical protein n=1 Tax=Bradyrhizobium sp. STM 3561 TaxID=578923 RepID=UPI0038904968
MDRHHLNEKGLAMNIQQQTSAQCASAAPCEQLLSNVYASRRGRSPSEPKGMANADTVMQRLESGLPLKDALMPGASYEGYHSHCKLFPERAARAKALVERNAEAGKKRKLEKLGVFRRRAMTHCARGHELSADNIRVRRYRGYTQRQCKKCEHMRQMETGPLPSPQKLAELTDAMKRGRNLAAIKKILPDTTAFYRTVRKVPEFAKVHHVWASGAKTRAGAANKRTVQQKRYNEIMSLLPPRMPLKIKIQIIGAIYEAHAMRRYRGKPFGITKAKANIKQFIADYNRENPSKAYGDIKTPWSLDAPVYDDGATTLADRATRSIWDKAPM